MEIQAAQNFQVSPQREEEVKIDARTLKNVKLIQAYYKKHLQYKKVRALTAEADFLHNNPVQPRDRDDRWSGLGWYQQV